eukprot:s1078_g13.t1
MSATLDSEAAFVERAKLIGVEQWAIDKIKAKKFATFGRLAFGISYSPQSTDETPLREFLERLLDDTPSADQMSCLRRLFFESNAMALTDVRVRVESNPDPAAATRKLPTAERILRQSEQEKRLGGLVFNPSTIPSNHLVDLFVEMMELGVLSYVKPESCCSRAQEVESVRKDPCVATNSSGLLKLGSRNTEPSCETNTELKLRAAWQRRNLAMDLSGLISFEVIESWTQFLFMHLMKEQPKGFSKISLQHILDCDKQIFIQASHMTMGKLAAMPGDDKPLDDTFKKLKDSNDVLQYLMPLPAHRTHEPPATPNPRPNKTAKTDGPAKGKGKGHAAGSGSPSKIQIPDGCVTHDDDKRPLFRLPVWEVQVQRAAWQEMCQRLPQAKVDSANRLYALAVEVILFCVERNIVVSVENPANSWLWAALVQLTLQHSHAAAAAYNQLEKVIFHACCHGSTRKKSTGWLSTPGVYSSLSATCQGDHPHEAWGVRWASGVWVFDTASEAAYPTLLAQRAAACMAAVAASRGYSLTPSLRLHDKSTAAQGKQTRKHPPLIPEFHHFLKHQLGATQPPGTRLIAPHVGGESREELNDEEHGTMDFAKFCKLGVFHTPKQFLSLAYNVGHPMDTTEHLEDVTRAAIDYNMKYPHDLIKLERKKNLLCAKLLAAQTSEQEKALHEALPASLAKVLAGKKLLVWKQLLEKYDYDDQAVFHFMHEGVKLVGMHDRPQCYPEKIKPAVLTQEDLESSALWRRRAILGKKSAASDPDHVAHLETTAQEELDLGFLEGPFDSEEAVSRYFGHNRWMVVRRFVLVQGAEMKLRPIDDCLEATWTTLRVLL